MIATASHTAAHNASVASKQGRPVREGGHESGVEVKWRGVALAGVLVFRGTPQGVTQLS